MALLFRVTTSCRNDRLRARAIVFVFVIAATISGLAGCGVDWGGTTLIDCSATYIGTFEGTKTGPSSATVRGGTKLVTLSFKVADKFERTQGTLTASGAFSTMGINGSPLATRGSLKLSDCTMTGSWQDAADRGTWTMNPL